jgi:hypothetical protein
MMKPLYKYTSLVFVFLLNCAYSQTSSYITRIEFNSGSRTFRQQIIITSDSIVSVKEDFRINLKPVVKSGKATPAEWKNILQCLKDVALEEIPSLKSPSDKRTYDGASHGSIIITTRDRRSFTHDFDDENPHAKLQPLMKQILKTRDKK